MKRLLLTLTGVLLVSPPAALQAAILLNEVHLNPPNPDENYEFIELKSTTNGVEALTGLSLIIINNDKFDEDTVPATALNIGEIAEVFSLNDLSTGANGLLLLGNGYTSNPRGGPWSGFVDPATAVADPAGFGGSDVGSNNGLSILLVSGFTGFKGQDLDTNNDKVLDITPWTAIVDIIGTADRDTTAPLGLTPPYVPTGANIYTTWISSSLGPRDPDTFARQLNNNTVSNAGSWYGGKLSGDSSTTVAYQTNRIFGPGNMLGEVTPGRPNLSTTLGATDFRINEIGLNPVGSNDRFQYIEIINTGTAPAFTPTARSLNNYWLVLVDSYDGSANAGDLTGVGRIIEKWDLSSMATGTNGLLLIGNDFTPSYNSFHDLVSPQTGFGDPVAHAAVAANGTNPAVPAASGLSEGDIAYKNGFTLLLVQSLPASALDDQDLDANDDGLLDAPMTWNVRDQVGFTQVARTPPPPTAIGRTYSTVDLRTVMHAQMVPDNISRKPKAGNLMAVSTAEWYGGVYPGGSPGFDVAYSSLPVVPTGGGAAYDPWFGGYRGAGTPGLPNVSGPVDASNPPAAASIRINEVMFNPTNTVVNDKDDTREYIELVSTNGGLAYLDNLWVIVVDLEGSIGNVAESFPLDGSMIGSNGIAIIGDNYDDPSSYPYAGVDSDLTPFCAAIDPVVSIGGNDLPNDGMCIMILRNPRTGAGNPLQISVDGLTLSGDLDPENDGVLVLPAAVADEVVDSISVAPVSPGPRYGWISNVPFKLDHMARYPGNFTAANGESWYYGKVSQAASANPALDYTSVFAGTFKGAGSPGRPNHGAPTGPISVGSVVLNEISIDPPGNDLNYEFVEFLDVNRQRRSLNGYYLVMLDNVVNNTGAIRHYWSLDGQFTGDNGLLLLGNHYPIGGTSNPWSSIMRPQTNTGDPPGRDGLTSSFTDNSLGDETDNTNVAFLLVRGFNKYIGYDMDEKVGDGQPGAADSPGDGVLDKVAWTDGNPAGIHDSVMFRDYIATVPLPAPLPPGYPWDGFAYTPLADLGTAFLQPPAPYYHPDAFARFNGSVTPNSAAAWYGGDLFGGPQGNDGTGVTYVTGDATHPPFPTGFTGRLTPGQPNLARDATSDPDGDGVSTFVELALNSNPGAADSPPLLPFSGLINVGGINYGTFTYRRIKGGSPASGNFYAAEGYTYTIETSKDLLTWGPGVAGFENVGTPTANTDGVTETVTYRYLSPASDPAGIPVRDYFRLRIGRQ